MQLSVETVVILASPLARAGIVALIEKYGHRVLAAAPDAWKVLASPPPESPRLVVLGNGGADELLPQAEACRREWPNCKIILLHQCSGWSEQQLIMKSSANACLTLFVSGDTLVNVLGLMMHEESDVFILVGARFEEQGSASAASDGLVDETSSKKANGGSLKSGVHGAPASEQVAALAPLSIPRTGIKMSERESQILNCVSRGLQNKVIARECGITEATVKVHMKSIMQKIQVGNRTQAAMWALENKPAAETLEERAPELKTSA